ncbi:unnamed protein product [Adineta ricciae]|uniref:N(6)-L-threonylcarbamoyladenine synthase n=1 Tax=Adineta ricciae TaxID=249248 RepID=A0A814T020_ADIRI|nr:unnamed protein product [Adineta ricciae]CAF1522056.1 unnamed protein product [Adineta ricciae]
MIQFILLFSRQGKLRLQKWYTPQTEKSKKKITRELIAAVLSRKPKMSSFLEWKDLKIVYKRYASLYFCCAIEQDDNELLTLETIHRYVELLDKYFGSVCELDIIFNFEKAYFIFDEFILGGEIQETSKKSVLKAINDQDIIQEMIIRRLSTHRFSHPLRILGIETSCDDTAAAVVDSERTILSEAYRTQLKYHQPWGGIVPSIAKKHHYENLVPVIAEAMKDIEWNTIAAIATSVKPGLVISLWQGINFTRQLLHKYSHLSFIPIHHMEAHALTVRLTHNVSFPYMVLLASGGHCILGIVEDVDKFYRLGETKDIAPGEALDKSARAMKLHEHTLVRDMVGGAAIGRLARDGDENRYQLITPKYSAKMKDCSFSFGGMLSQINRVVDKEAIYCGSATSDEQQLKDFAACVQASVVRHIETRIHRAILFCDAIKKRQWKRTLVLSGGVSSNLYLRQRIHDLCSHYGVELVCPPPQLCTDNGIMIAWNGIERYQRSLNVLSKMPEDLVPEGRSPLGPDISEQVRTCNIDVPFNWKNLLEKKPLSS